MIWKDRYYSKALIAKEIIGRANKNSIKKSYAQTSDLIVLNYHGTPQKFLRNFERQVVALGKIFKFLSPEEVTDYLNGEMSGGPYLLFTFDDGILNNKLILPILEKHGIKAIFFVVPEFIEDDNQIVFFERNIRPIINYKIDGLAEDRTAMSWSDLRELIRLGHTIGAHSMDHTMSKMDNFDQSQRQVIACKMKIEQELEIEVDSFCAPNNSLESVNKDAAALISKAYSHFHSTFPGANHPEVAPSFIKRSNVEAYWPMGAVYYALSKMEFNRYKKNREELDELFKNSVHGKN